MISYSSSHDDVVTARAVFNLPAAAAVAAAAAAAAVLLLLRLSKYFNTANSHQ